MADNMVKHFKKVSRQKLPFDHCGCRYERTPAGYKIHQRDFAMKLKLVAVPQRDESSKLTKEETSTFRSILGALLWITATRLDVIADVSVLQSRVTTAEVKDIKQANSILIKIRDYADVGLHYRIMENPNVRLMCIHDASAASKGRSYAQEGLIIGLAEDKFYGTNMPNEVEFKDGYGEGTVDQHGGTLHVLHASGSKAKRISYSTSHAETLSMVGGMEASTLVMVRLAEFHHPTSTFHQGANPSSRRRRSAAAHRLLRRLPRRLRAHHWLAHSATGQVTETVHPESKRVPPVWSYAPLDIGSNTMHDQ